MVYIKVKVNQETAFLGKLILKFMDINVKVILIRLEYLKKQKNETVIVFYSHISFDLLLVL